MAKKKEAKSKKLDQLVDDLLGNVGEDRDRLSNFLDKLLSEHSDQPAGIAEYVAKIADALTRQNQIKMSAAKDLVSQGDLEDDEEVEDLELSKKIGMPFAEHSEDSDGSN